MSLGQYQGQCLGEFQEQSKGIFLVQVSERQCKGSAKVSVMSSVRAVPWTGSDAEALPGIVSGALTNVKQKVARYFFWK